jgi:hypothetical protein
MPREWRLVNHWGDDAISSTWGVSREIGTEAEAADYLKSLVDNENQFRSHADVSRERNELQRTIERQAQEIADLTASIVKLVKEKP